MGALIIQVPEGGRLEERLREELAGVPSAEVTIAPLRPVSPGRIDPPEAARPVFSTASPEGLVTAGDELVRAVRAARGGVAPLAVVVEGAEELRSDQLAAALEAAAQAERDVILVLMREIEPA
jgi:hypothetical protein